MKERHACCGGASGIISRKSIVVVIRLVKLLLGKADRPRFGLVGVECGLMREASGSDLGPSHPAAPACSGGRSSWRRHLLGWSGPALAASAPSACSSPNGELTEAALVALSLRDVSSSLRRGGRLA